MAFKLYSDAKTDIPILCCDVCYERISDLWGDKATGSPGRNGETLGVTIHHKKCKPLTGTVTMPLIDFLRLFCVKSRIGDLGSDGKVETLRVKSPVGKRFAE